MTSFVYKVGAVKYRCGHIRSYSTIAESVLVLQKVLSTSVMGKINKQVAYLQGSPSILAVTLVLG